ncbi:YlcI/YnfO family protein [Cryobacterium sp. PH31-L1]|uniref:YlcI/YnfO family protein n=1 Tax=Cryobacterium sp. PH31-L1 TaxID=3046199 RepID=UPI0024B9EADE|nr:YlcI/YnfO family protein [Cryobacterium sp. PH31-L1]MDJ0377951.1 YlcI/YnfO family protein [Cryobacterium sp. PH31-L1]
MSRQIAVRLPDDIVDYLDHAVRDGRDSSRAAVITRALQRERRREVALRDVQILSAQPAGIDDLDELVLYGATLPTDLS